MPADSFVTIEPASTPTGYLARLLINENPFPGERGYISEADTKIGMRQVLWVLHGRLHLTPPGYRAEQVAGVRANTIVDVIVAPGQCEGFSRDTDGTPITAPRVEQRLEHLVRIANTGNRPGRFAGLLQYAQDMANAYYRGGIEDVDRFAELRLVHNIRVTGRAYSWMTDMDAYHPGGSFVSIPDDKGGAPGGNRFFTLKEKDLTK